MVKRNLYVILSLLFACYLILYIKGYSYEVKGTAIVLFWAVIILISFVIVNLSGLIYSIKKINKLGILVVLFLIFGGIWQLFLEFSGQWIPIATIAIWLLVCSNLLSFACAYFFHFIEKKIFKV